MSAKQFMEIPKKRFNFKKRPLELLPVDIPFKECLKLFGKIYLLDPVDFFELIYRSGQQPLQEFDLRVRHLDHSFAVQFNKLLIQYEEGLAIDQNQWQHPCDFDENRN